jgi:hypothetical protein
MLLSADFGQTTDDLLDSLALPFPAEVEFVISALEAGPRPEVERRRHQRRSRYRVRAALRLFSDQPGAMPAILFTRTINPQALGFVTARRLTLSHGGLLRLPDPHGGGGGGERILDVYCTVLRCREAAPGWCEGAVYFNREQRRFSREEMARLGFDEVE